MHFTTWPCILLVTLALATPPACSLKCINTLASWCPHSHIDVTCLCGNHLSYMGCITDICIGETYVAARDHFLGTCLEHHVDIGSVTNRTTLQLVSHNGYSSQLIKELNDLITNSKAAAKVVTESEPSVPLEGSKEASIGTLEPVEKKGEEIPEMNISTTSSSRKEETIGSSAPHSFEPFIKTPEEFELQEPTELKEVESSKVTQKVTENPILSSAEEINRDMKKIKENSDFEKFRNKEFETIEESIELHPHTSAARKTDNTKQQKESENESEAVEPGITGRERPIGVHYKDSDSASAAGQTKKNKPQKSLFFPQDININKLRGTTLDDNDEEADHIQSIAEVSISSNKKPEAQQPVSNSYPDPPNKIYKKMKAAYDEDGLQKYSGFVSPFSASRSKARLLRAATEKKNNYLGSKSNKPVAANHMPSLGET